MRWRVYVCMCVWCVYVCVYVCVPCVFLVCVCVRVPFSYKTMSNPPFNNFYSVLHARTVGPCLRSLSDPNALRAHP